MAAGGKPASPLNPGADLMTTSHRDEVHRFLRCGHTLGSLLREILDDSFLGGVCPLPLTRVQFCLLKLISVNGNLHAGEVARYLGVSPAAITKNVDKLESMGLVARTVSQKDRRATLLSATDDGAELVGKYEALKASRVLPAVDEISPETLEKLCDVLDDVCLEIYERRGSERGICLRCAGYYEPRCPLRAAQGDCALHPSVPPASGNEEITA
jgi:DNA-binding MarR family transcriptional regulator